MKNLVIKSDSMKMFMKQISRIAPNDLNILLLGDMGSGRKTWAIEIHELSTRRLKPIVILDCSLHSADVIEKDLFGKITPNSNSSKPLRLIGLLQAADGGSIVLLNVEKLTLSTQQKILSFITSGGSFSPEGSTEVLKSNVRMICTSTSELDQVVSRGDFLESLYYRINTLMVSVPRLFRRTEDIHELLVQEISETNISYRKTLSPEALKCLLSHEWKGNITELKNICQGLRLIPDDNPIQLKDLPEYMVNPSASKVGSTYHPDVPLYELEKNYIMAALNHYKGNKTQAANALGITIKTLYNKMHDYGMMEKND